VYIRGNQGFFYFSPFPIFMLSMQDCGIRVWAVIEEKVEILQRFFDDHGKT
jgi:hypothetical protein